MSPSSKLSLFPDFFLAKYKFRLRLVLSIMGSANVWLILYNGMLQIPPHLMVMLGKIISIIMRERISMTATLNWLSQEKNGSDEDEKTLFFL